MCGLFSVKTFSGDHIVCPRSGLVRITESRYKVITSQLVVKHMNQSCTTTQRTISFASRLEESADNSTDHGSELALVSSSEAIPVSLCHSMPEKEDRATSTEPVETKEKGIIAQVCTEEQAVSTDPQMVDQSTITSMSESADQDMPTTNQSTLEDETDNAESPGDV